MMFKKLKQDKQLPQFEKSPLIRYHLHFFGQVQGVGFRIEAYQMAMKLGITGWIRNNPDGTVEGAFQGEKNRVDFLLEHMVNLSRASVERVEKEVIELVLEEDTFKMDY